MIRKLNEKLYSFDFCRIYLQISYVYVLQPTGTTCILHKWCICRATSDMYFSLIIFIHHICNQASTTANTSNQSNLVVFLQTINASLPLPSSKNSSICTNSWCNPLKNEIGNQMIGFTLTKRLRCLRFCYIKVSVLIFQRLSHFFNDQILLTQFEVCQSETGCFY